MYQFFSQKLLIASALESHGTPCTGSNAAVKQLRDNEELAFPMATRTDPSSSDPPTAEPTAAAPGPQIDQDVGSDTDSALGEVCTWCFQISMHECESQL